MTEPLIVRIGIKTESINFLLGMHHFARAKLTKMHRTETWKAMRHTGFGQMSDSVKVTMTRESAGSLDDDNLRGALKACRDGIADWLGINDNDKRVEWVYQQRQVPRGTYAVVVQVEHLNE
jgi:hypothetical protein